MGERIASWFAIALVSVVLGTSYWYAQSLRGAIAGSGGRVGAVDFFAEGIALTGFDDQGRPRYRLFADRMTHFGNSDDIDMVKPRLVSMRPDQPQVRAAAQTARALNNVQSLTMRGNVVITRDADAAQPPLRIETDELSAVPDDDHFWTGAPVRMESGRSVLRSRGMDFDNIARRVELLAEVAGTYPARRRR